MSVTVAVHFTLPYGSVSHTLNNVIAEMLFYILSLPGCAFKVKIKLSLYGVWGNELWLHPCLSRHKTEVIG